MRLERIKTMPKGFELRERKMTRLKAQMAIRRFRGKLQWHGDLDAMRIDRIIE